MKTSRRLALALIGVLALGATRARAQSWTPMPIPADFAPSTALLLTDGSVLVQNINSRSWFKLVPNQFGNYLGGTWFTVNPMKNARKYFASAVLEDGRVFVAGGEYAGGAAQVELDAVEIFNPTTGKWKSYPTPGWGAIGDAPCAVLPNGTLLLGSIFFPSTAEFNPSTNTFDYFPAKYNKNSAEETWTLLPKDGPSDGNVLTANCNGHPGSQIFDSYTSGWLFAPNTTSGGGGDLVEDASKEIGPAVLLPNKKVLAFGATAYNDNFNTATSTWEPAPPFPTWTSDPLVIPVDPLLIYPGVTFPLGIKDGPACLLPNGNVLCATGPVDGVNGDYLGPTIFFEYHPALGPFPLPQPSSSFNSAAIPYFGVQGYAPFNWRMLMLPTGQVLVTDSFDDGNGNSAGEAFLYTPGPYAITNSWRPAITKCPANMTQGKTYTVHGTQFNGLSQCSSYGDDASNATNYPLVRVRNNATGHIRYLRTSHHSTMAVATGAAIVSTKVHVPLSAEGGDSTLEVVANGIPSKPFGVKIVAGR